MPSPTALKVTLQATQLSPSWHLDHIVCTVLEGGKDSTAGRKYYFVGNRSGPCSFSWEHKNRSTVDFTAP